MVVVNPLNMALAPQGFQSPDMRDHKRRWITTAAGYLRAYGLKMLAWTVDAVRIGLLKDVAVGNLWNCWCNLDNHAPSDVINADRV